MIYKIKNLECSYAGNNVVLSVPDLIISPGQIVVVLGKSGYGKSTLLETLALMNHTIHKGEVSFFPPSMGGKLQYELSKIWDIQNGNEAAKIRAAHFSFIFQQTNLMPNFTVYENIYITKMIQGFPEAVCRKETSDILDRIGLSSFESNRKVTEISGGQRQRVAFARAIISSFDVLFGDEPTGNLDEVNAKELLTVLADFIHDKSREFPTTAIIVTHNIEMAIEFADSIIVINKDNNAGFINPSGVYSKQKMKGETIWKHGTESLNESAFTSYLRSQFFSI